MCLELQDEGCFRTSAQILFLTQTLALALALALIAAINWRTHLGQRRVGVDVEFDVLDLLPRRHRVGGLVNEVRSMQPEDVHAQDLARVLPAEPKPQNI